MSLKNKTLLALCSIAMALPVTSYSQTGEATLEEIIVTARKREENLQMTPISLSVLSEQALSDRDATNVADLARLVPNFSFQPATAGGSSSGQFFIRGVGQFDFINTNDPSVALYLDGAIIPRTAGAAFALPDVDRIEVLRGPQGTLFGRNTVAGTVNIITKQPGDEAEGQLNVTVGSRNRHDFSGYVMGPIIEGKLYGKVAASSFNQDGYIERVATGEDMSDRNNQSISGVLRWLPSDDVEISLGLDYMRKRGNSGAETMTALGPSPLRDLYNQLVLTPNGQPLFDATSIGNQDDTNTGVRNRDDYDHWGATLTATWDLGFGQVKSITSYRELETHFGLDFDGSPAPFADEYVDDDGHYFSQELQLSGTAMDGRLDWLIGAYYFDETSKSDLVLLFLDGGAALPDDFTNFSTFFLTTADRSVIENNDVEIESIALFAQGTYRFTDKWSITAGIRYTNEEKQLAANHFEFNDGGQLIDVDRGDEWDSVTPRIGLEFQATDDAMLYFSASRGFRSGGFQGRAFSGNPDAVTVYDPEFIWAYELGLKSEWFDNRVRLNASGYFYDYTDFQFDTTVVENGVTLFTRGNAAEAEISGFEADLIVLPTPELRLYTSLAHIDAKFTEVDARVLNLTLDTEIVNAPKWTVSAGAEYDFNLGNGDKLTLRADYLHKSKFYFLFTNNPLDIEDGYSTIDAKLTYRPQSKPWEVSVFGKNITNETYKYLSITNSAFFGGATVTIFAPESEWGASFTYRF